jgi:short subunit dehydrogenase-like uncharacterized protein
VHQRDAEIKSAGIVAMPGVGFDVVPSDCLAAMLKREMPGAVTLRLAFKSHYGKLCPGTTKTMVEGLPEGCKVRKDGKIVSVPPAYKIETIPFTAGESSTAVTIPWGDVSTAYYSTGIPNIEVFMGAGKRRIESMALSGWKRALLGLPPVQAFLKGRVAKQVKGPTEAERARDEMLLYGEVRDVEGRTVAMRMRTPEGYTLTVMASLAAVARVLENGSMGPGALTPSMAFGPDFVLSFEGVRCERIECLHYGDRHATGEFLR